MVTVTLPSNSLAGKAQVRGGGARMSTFFYYIFSHAGFLESAMTNGWVGHLYTLLPTSQCGLLIGCDAALVRWCLDWFVRECLDRGRSLRGW